MPALRVSAQVASNRPHIARHDESIPLHAVSHTHKDVSARRLDGGRKPAARRWAARRKSRRTVDDGGLDYPHGPNVARALFLLFFRRRACETDNNFTHTTPPCSCPSDPPFGGESAPTPSLPRFMEMERGETPEHPLSSSLYGDGRRGEPDSPSRGFGDYTRRGEGATFSLVRSRPALIGKDAARATTSNAQPEYWGRSGSNPKAHKPAGWRGCSPRIT